MLKYLILFLLPIVLIASEIKEEIAGLQDALISSHQKGEIHYKLASAFYRDQESDQAFQHFLCALKLIPAAEAPDMCEEEKKLYTAALEDYLAWAGSDPVRVARQLLEKYGEVADAHHTWVHLNFLIATAYGNLGLYDEFFKRFYCGYGYLSETFLAYKTHGILCLRLAQHGKSAKERHAYKEEAFHYLTGALERNPIDSGLYKVLIFLAKDENNDALVHNYLQKMVEHEAHISRGDVYLYVREAVALGELALGQQIVDLARTQYDFSRAILAAQEYLTQWDH